MARPHFIIMDRIGKLEDDIEEAYFWLMDCENKDEKRTLLDQLIDNQLEYRELTNEWYNPKREYLEF
mgnify:CR=1 FL=1|jgi:hypothetical protein